MELYFRDHYVETSREVILYDGNTIVAAVGGSLGLFLGFSCLEFVTCLFDWVARKTHNHHNHR